MERLLFVAIQQPGAAESAESQNLQRNDLQHRQAATAGRDGRIPRMLHSNKSAFPLWISIKILDTQPVYAQREREVEEQPWSYIRREEASASSQGRYDSLINNSGSLQPDAWMRNSVGNLLSGDLWREQEFLRPATHWIQKNVWSESWQAWRFLFWLFIEFFKPLFSELCCRGPSQQQIRLKTKFQTDICACCWSREAPRFSSTPFFPLF